jgi:predicted transcriptional regulator of viral defense system
MTSVLIKRFNRNKGYLRNTGSLPRDEKYELKLMLVDGKVIKVKRGLYRLAEATSAQQESEVSHIVPDGIFCMYTAWAHYELTTHIPSEYHVAILKSSRISLPDYPPIKLYYWNEPTFELGAHHIKSNGARIRMYDMERSICDAVKFRNKVGNEILSEILKNYVKKKDKNIDRLMKYAVKLRISKTLNQFLPIIL